MAQPIWPQPPMPRLVPRRQEDAPRSLSQRLWNLDWRDDFPLRFDDAQIEAATAEDVMPFVQAHYPAIFGHKDLADRFLPSPTTDAKKRFFAEMDYFVFRVGGDVVGVAMGNASDWTTYYVRSAAVLPEYRERGLLTRFFEHIDAPLRAVGVERIEAETSPANVPIVRLLTGRGYVVNGSTSSERWGLLLRYTKYLSEDARAAFVRQYTALPVIRGVNDNKP